MSNQTISIQLQLRLQQFMQWHENLQAKLAQLNLKGAAERAYLEEILPITKQFYYDTLEQLSTLCLGFSKQQKKEVFSYLTTLGLHEKLKTVPYFYQSIFKPRGYAGDAEMMAFVYRNEYEGADTFSKLLHKIGTECAACVAIRNRIDLLQSSFSAIEEGQNKVLSLAAGPACEIQQHLETGQQQLDFLALDHDPKTIQAATYSSPNLTYGMLNAFHLIQGNYNYTIPAKSKIVQTENVGNTASQSLAGPAPNYTSHSLQSESFDLIYSAGLFDYIETYLDENKGTIALTKRLFDLLRPNGRLLIGNVSPQMPKYVIWAMECLCDWHLIYRTAEEVFDFASSIPKKEIASIRLLREPAGINWFLDIRKNNTRILFETVYPNLQKRRFGAFRQHFLTKKLYKMKKTLILTISFLYVINIFSQTNVHPYSNEARGVLVEVLFPLKPIETSLDNVLVKQSTASAVALDFAYFLNIQKGKKVNVPKLLEKNMGGTSTITKEYKIGKHQIVEFDFITKDYSSRYKVINYKKGFVWLSVTGATRPEDKDVEPFFNSIKLDKVSCIE